MARVEDFDRHRYNYRETFTEATTTDPIFPNSSVHEFTAGIAPGGGNTITVQISFCPRDVIEAGSAEWYTGLTGNSKNYSTFSHITAFRIVTTGAGTVNIAGSNGVEG